MVPIENDPWKKNGKEYLEKAMKRGKANDTFNFACEILP